ncbi:uncharacterized protein [Leptinotarsa decemlineata]|uniref:uncharacterized protein n=1 Tax=Leptinotarsa decemlineata TaxID=7539 RepID=UPI003D307DE5
MDQSRQRNFPPRAEPGDVYSGSFIAVPNFGLVQQINLNLCLLPQGGTLAPLPGLGYQVPQMYSVNIPVATPVLLPCHVATDGKNMDLLSATQEVHNFSPGTCVNLKPTGTQKRTDNEVTTSDIVEQGDGGNSPIPVIKQELIETQKQNDVNIDVITTRNNSTGTIQQQDDDIICSGFNIKQELIVDHEQESSIVIPTTTSEVVPKLAGAQERNEPSFNNLVANRDLGQPLRVSFTNHQLMVLEQEFSVHRFPSKMERVEISRKLQLSEKQVKIWFQNRRMRSKKYCSRIEQNRQSTEQQKNNNDSATPSEISDETSPKQNNGNISWTPSIKQELTESLDRNEFDVDIDTRQYSIEAMQQKSDSVFPSRPSIKQQLIESQEQNEFNVDSINTGLYSIETMQRKSDSVFSPILSIKQELTEDQEQNNCTVIPTVSPHSLVAANEDNVVSPTSSVNPDSIGAQQRDVLESNNLLATIDLTKRFRTIFTKQQLEVLADEFKVGQFLSRARRAEISNRLQLSERQVTLWFQNQRMKNKKVGCAIPQTR